MEFNIKNLGNISNAKIELGPLTIISGKNNQGKSYITYAVYGFLRTWTTNVIRSYAFRFKNKENSPFRMGTLKANTSIQIDLKEFEDQIPLLIRRLSETYTETLPQVFSANAQEFEKASFIVSQENIHIDYDSEFFARSISIPNSGLSAHKAKQSSILEIKNNPSSEKGLGRRFYFDLEDICTEFISRFFLKEYLTRAFIITSERTGIHLFQKELDVNKNVLVDHLLRIEKNKSIDPFNLINETVSRYSLPIKDNIDFVRDIDTTMKSDSFLKNDKEVSGFIEKMLNVEYKFTNGQQVVQIKQGRRKKSIPQYLASTSVRSLSDLNIYIKHIAKEGDVLVIDEPEINLHPENQVKIARLFIKLVNRGVKVFITTHSDYILKEINNLIMLSNDFINKQNIMTKYSYKDDETLLPEKVNAYIATEGSLEKVDVDKFGLQKTSFDKTIEEISEISEEIAFHID